MTRPFDKFGGWLRFLWILTLLSGVIDVLILTLVLTRPSMLIDESIRSTITTSSVLVHALANGLLASYCFYILWLMPKRELDVPSSIGAFVVTTAIFRVVLIIADYLWGNASVTNALTGDPFHLSEFARTVISAIIWFQYVKVSDRVKAYYGTNAFSGPEARLEGEGPLPTKQESSVS